MKYAIIISIVLLFSCKEQKVNNNEQDYAFENIDTQYETLTPKDNNNKTIKIERKKPIISDKESKEIRKIFDQHREVSKNFYHYHNDYEYKPSSKFNHIKHIRENSRIGQMDGIAREPKFFIDYIIQNQLEKPEHKKYLTDRKLLRPLTRIKCDSNHILIRDTLLNGQSCEIEIFAKKFIEKNHDVKFRNIESGYKDYLSIDGKFPYGGLYGNIKTELSKIDLTIGNRKIKLNKATMPSINEPELCNRSMLENGIEAYQDDNYLYIYVSGGSAADTYFGKLIFNQTEFVTSIFIDYVPMSMYGSFGKEFLAY